MDASRFDALVRAIATGGTRRRLLRLVAALPLGGALLANGDEAAAERPHERLGRRTQQRNRQQRNQQRRNKNNNKNRNNKHNNKHNNGGGGNPDPCTPNNQACTRSDQCCSENCFNFVCAATISTCGQGSSATPCDPAAVGCCPVDGCCQPPANQCNNAGLCCAPNCAGRECGPDGCCDPQGCGHEPGTCGSCGNGQTCDVESGQCQGQPTCSPATCPGCCDKNGRCQPGDSEQACGTGGERCVNCPGPDTCQSGQCHCTPNCQGKKCGSDGCFASCGSCPPGQTCIAQSGQCRQGTCGRQTCPQGCCDTDGTCEPGNNATFCGTNGEKCVTCQPAQICTKQGQCQDEFSCDSENCNGCCDPAPFVTGAVCRAGNTEQACGTDGAACVKCPGSDLTCQNGQCVCTPQCHGKECGPDGCGGSCGSCSACQTCTSAGQCQPGNYCEDGTSLCGGGCNCLVKSDGTPFCTSGLGPCLNCKADGDAACAQVGAGYACVSVAGDHCIGCPDTEDFACLSACGMAVTTSARQGRRLIPRP